ncbi:SPOR domain-containing protein [Rickettsiella grylli]|uniref:Sporulation domain protein n=1 Tax=Rickettsiella grylli TaxID=59196 RepID=A8PME5_9COXI|nr:SPOR domain-containing protein [Rickettsiella grylli]EDP46801.1 sporulation domain protein [Rickettsiella grylli]
MVSSKRTYLIFIISIAALWVIFVPLFMKEYHTKNILSFTIPSLPTAPTAALLPITSAKPSLKTVLNFPLAPAKAWVVELPDIKDAREAENLVQNLRRKGFNAYSRQYKSLLGMLTRVFVGPEIKPDQMKKIAEQLHTEMHLTTQIVPFDPLLIQ